jgi:hypothetical protein
VPDQSYRCISPACVRSWPRPVNFCPYCGTAQHDAATASAAARQPAQATAAVPAVALEKAGAGPAAERLTTDWGASAAQAGAAPVAGQGAAAGLQAKRAEAAPAPRVPVAARPPEREPVRLRWWLLALAGLWLVWSAQRPTAGKIDARIDRAIALASECKAREAQSELIALRSTRASPEQLQRLQQALNDAAAACSRSRQRGKAWRGGLASADDGAVDGVARPLERRIAQRPARRGTRSQPRRSDADQSLSKVYASEQ